jgi:quinoprotein glucose dehydrogenase
LSRQSFATRDAGIQKEILMAAIITGGIVALLGLAILGLGVWLTTLGGSPFYIVIGLGLLWSALLLVRRKQSGLIVYAALLALVFVWTLWEVGFDKWQWIPRGALLTFIGLWIALPFVVRNVRKPDSPRGLSLSNGPLLLRSTVAVIAALAIGAWFYDPLLVEGELPVSTAAAEPAVPGTAPAPTDDWIAYGGTNLGQRYSALTDINTGNVKTLKLAWEHHTGDVRQQDDASEFTFEATPLKVNGLLYFCTPHNIIEALDPQTGAPKWRFDPKLKPNAVYQHQTCRGVSYHDAATAPAVAAPAAPAQAAVAPATGTDEAAAPVAPRDACGRTRRRDQCLPAPDHRHDRRCAHVRAQRGYGRTLRRLWR